MMATFIYVFLSIYLFIYLFSCFSYRYVVLNKPHKIKFKKNILFFIEPENIQNSNFVSEHIISER